MVGVPKKMVATGAPIMSTLPGIPGCTTLFCKRDLRSRIRGLGVEHATRAAKEGVSPPGSGEVP
ncbi:hypothetical protein AA0535_2500 [Asaia krungthepensis NRIC 0535]|uniref:Uncharacterized protein n=1 Tax=Asaia krungthepensis NRIC 0535 TaxID=1307925 RepID=A0ABQ0Q5C4_9PROT|nr:hypothetical protein AA0535_2500 [Asaia krungthepensis NRIC 0535]